MDFANITYVRAKNRMDLAECQKCHTTETMGRIAFGRFSGKGAYEEKELQGQQV